MSSEKIPVDLELKKAFTELQQKRIDSSQKLQFVNTQADGIKRSILHKQITDKELNSLPVSTKVYQGVGRCFIASTIPEIRQGIGKSISELEDKVTKLDQNKDFIINDLKGTENQLRELVASKKKSTTT